MSAAPQQETGLTPFTVVCLVLVVAAIIYSFGYLRAVMHRANRDYKTTKAAVPTLRKAFWSAWWGAVKVGTGVILAVVILIYWGVSDQRERDRHAPAPSPSASPK